MGVQTTVANPRAGPVVAVSKYAAISGPPSVRSILNVLVAYSTCPLQINLRIWVHRQGRCSCRPLHAKYRCVHNNYTREHSNSIVAAVLGSWHVHTSTCRKVPPGERTDTMQQGNCWQGGRVSRTWYTAADVRIKDKDNAIACQQ